MTSSTPSALSRYRPAILVLTGAAAAYTAYLIYSNLQHAPSEGGLHRSNAVRRPNPRPRRDAVRTVARLQRNPPLLGEFDFFGSLIELDVHNIVTPTELRQTALRNEPSASPELIESRMGQFYDTFFDRLLALAFPSRALSQAERDAVFSWLGPDTSNVAVAQALQRHSARFANREGDAVLNQDETESIPATEISLFSDDFSDDDGLDADGQTLQRTLYHIAEDRARQDGVIHRGITCNGCDTKPIRGIRWRCANCADYDLCSDCEATNSHIKTHIFYKIRVPAPYLGLPKQEPVYPGRPHVMPSSINPSLRKRLVAETKMEAEEIEALWDQFTCLAGTEWETDPNHVCWALDRRAFNHAFIPRYSTFISAPNLIYDRIFAYYDTDHNGLIGIEEFIKGLDGMHSRDPKLKVRIVFNGYDVDGDGYISRKDVLRIFRAYYAIEKEATRNYLAEAAEELSVRGALETVHSSQPLGSAFTHNMIPGRDHSIDQQRLQEKPVDPEYVPVVHDDTDDTIDREDFIRTTYLGDRLTNGRSEAATEAVRDRWARRQFYTDEEEGLEPPEDVEDTPPTYETENQADEHDDSPPMPEQERPRWSRSSSRVRFQDDVDFETRSNASTSSRPIGERWGGYEVPEPEKDLGKEVLYQITQQAFNELLNPLFLEKEDNAMDVDATRGERRSLQSEIDEAVKEFNNEKDFDKAVIFLGVFQFAKWVISIITDEAEPTKVFFEKLKKETTSRLDAEKGLKDILSTAEHAIANQAYSSREGWEPDVMDLWNARLCRLQLRQELTAAILELVTKLGWLPVPTPPQESPNTSLHVHVNGDTYHTKTVDAPYRDPTMPQFRPNSLADLQQVEAAEDSNDSDSYTTSPTPDSSSAAMRMRYGDAASDTFSETSHIHSYTSLFVEIARSHSELSAETELHTPSSTSNPATVETAVPAPRSPPPPRTPPATTPPMLPRHPSLNHHASDPIHFRLSINVDSLSLHAEHRWVSHVSSWEQDTTYKPFERKIRHEAMNRDSPLHIPFLASLQVVEEEMRERKGSGLLSFEEFEAKMAEGKLRFLEAWMDWVSF